MAESRATVVFDDIGRVFRRGGSFRTPELQRFLQNTAVSFAVGGVVGGWIGARQASERFWAGQMLNKLPKTAAESLHYNTALAPRMFSGFIQQGGKSALLMSLLVGGFTLVEVSIGLSRNKDDWINGLCTGVLSGLGYGLVGRLGRKGVLQLVGIGAVCGALYGLGNEAVKQLDQRRSSTLPPDEQPELTEEELARLEEIQNSIIENLERSAQRGAAYLEASKANQPSASAPPKQDISSTIV